MATKLTTKQTKFIAAYLGPANGNATEAARQAGYAGTDDTLRSVGAENLTKPVIAEAIEASRAEIRNEGIAVQQARIDAADDRWERMKQLIEARAADPKMSNIPGGTTGLLVHSQKVIGGGPSAQTVDEYQFDAALVKEMRELEKHISDELGQRTQKLDIRGAVTFADLHALAATGASADHSRSGE